MSVKHMWFKDTVFLTLNKILVQNEEDLEYDEKDEDFMTLQKAAMICSEARFDTSSVKEISKVDYLTCPVLGDATETGLIRFY